MNRQLSGRLAMPFHPLSPRLFDLLANQRIVFERILCLRLLLRFRQLRRSGAESVSRWPKWGAGRVKFALAPMDLICGGGYVRTLLPLGSSAAFEHRLITFAPSKEIIFECRGKKATPGPATCLSRSPVAVSLARSGPLSPRPSATSRSSAAHAPSSRIS